MVFIMNIGKSILALTDLFFYEITLLQTPFDKWIQLKVIFKWEVITLNYKLFNYISNSSNFSWKVLKGCSNTSKLSTYLFLLIFQSWKQLFHHQCPIVCLSIKVCCQVHHSKDTVSNSHILVPWWLGIKYQRSLCP